MKFGKFIWAVMLTAGLGLGANASFAKVTVDQLDKAAKMVVAPININTANVQQLTELSGIGESKAKAIVAYRQQHGDFKSVDDLTQVKGIGEGIIAKIKSRLTVK